MVEPAFALHLVLEISIPVRGRLDRCGIVGQVQSGQPLIRRNGSQTWLRADSAVDVFVLMSQAVIVAEGKQRTKLKLDSHGPARVVYFVLHDRRVLAPHHKNGLLDPETVDFKGENREWIEAELC